MNLKPFRKCASSFVSPSFDKILHDLFGQFVENWNFSFKNKSYIKKSDVENLKNLFLFHGLL